MPSRRDGSSHRASRRKRHLRILSAFHPCRRNHCINPICQYLCIHPIPGIKYNSRDLGLLELEIWCEYQENTNRSPRFLALLQSDSVSARSAKFTEPSLTRFSNAVMISMASSFDRVTLAYLQQSNQQNISQAFTQPKEGRKLTCFHELGLLLPSCLTSKWLHLIFPACPPPSDGINVVTGNLFAMYTFNFSGSASAGGSHCDIFVAVLK